MNPITLPPYFDDPNALCGQLAETADHDLLTAALILWYDFPKEIEVGVLSQRPRFGLLWLFDQITARLSLIDPSAPNGARMDRVKLLETVRDNAGFSYDPTLLMASSAYCFLGALVSSAFVLWRDCRAEITQSATEANAYIQKNKITYTDAGRSGTVYWKASEKESGEVREGVETFSGAPVELSFTLPRRDDLPYPRKMDVIAVIRIETF